MPPSVGHRSLPKPGKRPNNAAAAVSSAKRPKPRAVRIRALVHFSPRFFPLIADRKGPVSLLRIFLAPSVLCLMFLIQKIDRALYRRLMAILSKHPVHFMPNYCSVAFYPLCVFDPKFPHINRRLFSSAMSVALGSLSSFWSCSEMPMGVGAGERIRIVTSAELYVFCSSCFEE